MNTTMETSLYWFRHQKVNQANEKPLKRPGKAEFYPPKYTHKEKILANLQRMVVFEM